MEKQFVVANRGSYKYRLEDRFMVAVNRRTNRKYNRYARIIAKAEISYMLQRVFVDGHQDFQVVTYTSGRNSFLVRKTAANGFNAGCHNFTRDETVKLAKWAGWTDARIKAFIPKVKKSSVVPLALAATA